MARTIEGRDYMSDRLFGNPASSPTQAQIIALSENADAILASWSGFGAAGDEELSADGFARQVGVYAHTQGEQTSTLQHTFTHTGPSGGGTARTIRKVAVVAQPNGGAIPGAVNSGIYVFIMDQPNPPTLTGTDSLNQLVSIDFGA